MLKLNALKHELAETASMTEWLLKQKTLKAQSIEDAQKEMKQVARAKVVQWGIHRCVFYKVLQKHEQAANDRLRIELSDGANVPPIIDYVSQGVRREQLAKEIRIAKLQVAASCGSLDTL